MVQELQRQHQSASFPETSPAANPVIINDKDPYRMIRLDIAQEHLRQARQTFNLSLVSRAASISISIVGAFLLISGKANEGSVTAAMVILSTTYCSQSAQKSSKTLEELRENLKNIYSSDE